VLLIAPDGREHVLNTKGTFTAPPGAQIVMRAPGSGGYGPPSERDPARLREDVINGYVTAERLVEVYGRGRSGEPACRACESSGSPRSDRWSA
jgi:N-methylhydantoinase B